MKLWSDYEGRTIAEVYPLKKLLRPEGRSAFFVTTNGTGTASLVRIIEAHFDESEILHRWQTISEINQENLVTMRKFGETVLDGTPLVYAVMEPTEISLDELLANRTLTVDEAKQLAASLLSALKVLHERGFVHGHIEPINILAAGETVKLRSDCVKPAVDDPDGIGPNIAEQKAADVHAVAVVLLQALTGRTSLQGSATLLPSPFDGIIRNGLSGRWGLAEMTAALGPVSPAQVAAAVPQATKPAAATQTAANQSVAKPVEPAATTKVEPAADVKTAESTTAVQESLFEKQTPATAAATASPAKPAVAPAASTSPRAVADSLPIEKPATPLQTPDVRHRIVRPVEEDDAKRNRMIVAGIAALVLLALLIGWRMMRSEPSASANTPAATSSTSDAANKPAASPAPIAAAKPSAIKPLSGRASSANRATVAPASPAPAAPAATAVNNQAATGGKTQWRVVAFTYNHEDQAQHKAETIAKQHPSLNAEVFSPTGHAPYLVTVGGPMTREQAEAFKQQARNQGLPRDTYAQNYSH